MRTTGKKMVHGAKIELQVMFDTLCQRLLLQALVLILQRQSILQMKALSFSLDSILHTPYSILHTPYSILHTLDTPYKMVQDPPSTVAFMYCIKASCIGTITSLVGFIAGYAALYKLHVRYLLFHSRLNNVVGAAASCSERPRQFVEGGRWSDRSAHCRNDWGPGSINPCY